ncbi:hypothetical protein PR048_006618 [Dryococelus australis]|uniref:Gustatory receptor n=1 Tax=Dryococelus australis TaxID=614101 RepID=A0ABQ9ICT3_9NEOP|nr:hypothetical protein PR048_006618 [Dryococelus australis]
MEYEVELTTRKQLLSNDVRKRCKQFVYSPRKCLMAPGRPNRFSSRRKRIQVVQESSLRVDEYPQGSPQQPQDTSIPPIEAKGVGFIRCLEPTAAVSQVVGLGTFRITMAIQDGGIHRPFLKRSVGVTIYTFTLVTAVLIIIVIFIYMFVNDKVVSIWEIFSLVRILLVINVTITILTGAIGVLLNNKVRQEMLERFVAVDEILLEKASECYMKWARSTKLLLTFAYAMVIMIFAIIKSISNGIANDPGNWLWCAEDLMILTMVANYTNIILLLRQRFIFLNTKLREVCYNRQLSCNTMFTGRRIFRDNNEICVSRMHFNRGINLSENEHRSRDNDITPPHFTCLLKISSLRIAFSDLYKIASLINSAYGVLVLYSFFLAYVHSREAISIGFMWGVINIIQAVVIISACSATVQAAKKTAGIVQHLLLETGIDEDARVQLKEFHDQIESTELEFTAAGFFTPSMASSIRSYILVLLQINPPARHVCDYLILIANTRDYLRQLATTCYNLQIPVTTCDYLRLLATTGDNLRQPTTTRHSPGFPHVGIVPDDSAGRRVFSEISRFPHPLIQAPNHTNLNRNNRLSRPRCLEPPKSLHSSASGEAGGQRRAKFRRGNGQEGPRVLRTRAYLAPQRLDPGAGSTAWFRDQPRLNAPYPEIPSTPLDKESYESSMD